MTSLRRNGRDRSSLNGRWAALALGGALGLGGAFGLAGQAAAYVVVTADNMVHEVATRPEVRGDRVYFTTEGVSVSLRIFEVNVAKTNEINQLMERGGDMAAVASQVRQLRPASVTDDRIIVSSRLVQAEYERRHAKAPEIRLVRNRGTSSPSFADEPGPSDALTRSGASVPRRREAAPAEQESSFSREARRALDEAERSVASERSGDAVSPRASARAGERAAELDAELEAEQEYLRQLSSGGVAVDDLDRAISKSMDKIRGLQQKRDRIGSRAAAADDGEQGAAPAERGNRRERSAEQRPSGSREERIQREIDEAESRLERLRSQQAAIPSGASDEREVSDELIGETEYRLQKLRKRLAAAEGR